VPGGKATSFHVRIQLEEMNSAGLVRERRDEILRVAARHGAGNVRLFGSAARGEDTSQSDIDLLIDVTGTTSSWFPGSLTAELEELLGKRVQVVIRRSLSPLIQEAVLREAVPL
jgi:predicted nucleotidyltransferase